MILETYQSKQVLDILKAHEIYKAYPSISFKGEYGALIKMLDLKCDCPIFTVVKGRKQNTHGRVSSSVKLTLNVPDEKVKLTEYGVWADFMYCYKFTKQGDFTKLRPDCNEVSVRKFTSILENLKTQRPLESYQYPQAILEYIDPKWLTEYKVINSHAKSEVWDFVEKIFNIFRK